jgi:hypothetical protein
MAPPAPQGARDPVQLATVAGIDDETRAGFAPGATHRAVIQQLVSAGKFPEAVRMVAFALPRREGVWWAWVMAKRASGAAPAPPLKAVLEATERWIAQPSDQNRRVAWDLAQAADIGTPAGCAGAAAFFAGESIAPVNVQALPPGEFDAARMIAGSVIMSVVSSEPEQAPEKFVAAIQQGLDVISKIKLWPADDGAPPLQPPPAAAV